MSDTSRGWTIFTKIKTLFYKLFFEWIIILKNNKKEIRFLEIGPGDERIRDFETINIIKTKNTDYVSDVSKKIDFPDKTFNIVYASHILEHIPWYMLEKTIKEWTRVLKIGGSLEVWVPDGLKIAKAFCDSEQGINNDFMKDGWYRFNEEKDPTKWFSGRMFSYGDGIGTRGHFNFHLATFSERYLKKLFIDAGFKNIVKMDNSECRGYDHGWINLGIKGTKK